MATSTQSVWPQPASAAGKSSVNIGQNRWVRALTPTFADCFFVALIAWLFVCGASGWKSLLGDGDTGWHIRTGQYILAHHAVPTRDLFSFSKPNAQWFAWEWLSDVVFAGLFQIAGLKGIVLFAGSLIALYATVLLRFAIWLGSNALVALTVSLLAVGASSMHFLARPHLFTLLAVPCCFWLILADARHRTPWLWILIPVTALWVNLHGGFTVFLACLAMFIAGSAIEVATGRPRWALVRRHSLLLAGCSLASLANPYGIQLHVHIVEYLRASWIKDLIEEFQAPTFRSEGQLQFEALLVAGLVLCGFLLRKHRIAETFCILFLAHSALTSVRHAPLFAAVTAPLIGSELSEWWARRSANLGRGSVVRIVHELGEDLKPVFRRNTVWPGIAVLALALIGAPIKWPQDFPSERFPIQMVKEHAGLLQSARLLTTDQWGDYIIYRFYPRQRVFVDGRSDFYGERLGREYLRLFHGSYDWREIMDHYGFDVALLPADLPLATLLKRDAQWRIVADDHSSILLKRISIQDLGD